MKFSDDSWSKDLIEWTDSGIAYLSVPFTWDMPRAREYAVRSSFLGYVVKAGGPAVALMPDYLADVAQCNGEQISALKRHNPQATFTSRGCIRRCPFCAVPKIEGTLRELKDWEPAPIVCDNNLLACSRTHFDRVIDRLKPFRGRVDFNQGLDARLLMQYHADRLAELRPKVRLAFDSVSYESSFMRAYERLRKAKIPKANIGVYVLFGFCDTPEDALYRLQTVKSLGIRPNPMRYQPLDTLEKNSYVGPNWTQKELSRYMRYWSRLRFFESIPFCDFDTSQRSKDMKGQLRLDL